MRRRVATPLNLRVLERLLAVAHRIGLVHKGHAAVRTRAADLALRIDAGRRERLGPGQVGTVVAFVLLRSKIDEGRKGKNGTGGKAKKWG